MTLLCRLLTATVRKLTQTKYTHKNTYSQLHVKNPNSDHEISWLTYIIYKKKNISIMHICYKVCFPSKQMCIHISKQIKMKGKKEEMTLSVKSHENLHTFNQTCLRIINKVWGFLLYLIKNSCFFVWEIKVITAPTENMLSKLPNFYLCMQHVLQATKQKAAKVPFFRETFMGNKNNTETSCKPRNVTLMTDIHSKSHYMVLNFWTRNSQGTAMSVVH